MRDDFLSLTGLTASCSNTAIPTYVGQFSLWEHADVSSRLTIPLRNQVAHWVAATVQQLESIGRLRRGWDSYGGLPLKPEARNRMVETIRALERSPEHASLPAPSVVLNSGGTVGLEWSQAGRELEIDIGEEDGLDFVTCGPDGKIVDEGQVSKDAPYLNSLVRWFLSGRVENQKTSIATSHGSP